MIPRNRDLLFADPQEAAHADHGSFHRACFCIDDHVVDFTNGIAVGRIDGGIGDPVDAQFVFGLLLFDLATGCHGGRVSFICRSLGVLGRGDFGGGRSSIG